MRRARDADGHGTGWRSAVGSGREGSVALAVEMGRARARGLMVAGAVAVGAVGVAVGAWVLAGHGAMDFGQEGARWTWGGGVASSSHGVDGDGARSEGEGEGEVVGTVAVRAPECVAVRSGGDGFGAQYLRQMSGYALAASTGRRFCFLPFGRLEHVEGEVAARKASAATGMGELACSEARCASMAVLGGGRALALVFRTRGRGTEAGPSFPVSGPGVHRRSVTRMFGAGVAERLRSMYDSGRRPARGEGGAGSGVPRIAVHIRRGDAPGSRIVSVQVYEAVFRLLRERWPGAQVDVFSEGRDGWREPRWAAALGSARSMWTTTTTTTTMAITTGAQLPCCARTGPWWRQTCS